MYLCPPGPSQFLNLCLSKPAIAALSIGGASILLGLILVILILKAKNKKIPHYSLLTYIVTTVIAGPAVGVTVVLAPNTEVTFYALLAFIITNVLMMYAYFWFLDLFLENTRKLFTYVVLGVLTILSAVIIIKPDLVLAEIFWSQQLGWYDFSFQGNVLYSIFPLFPIYIPLTIGVFKLIKAFRKTKSPIQRNRIKYIALATGIYMCGWLSYLSPIQSLRYIPIDAVAAVLSGGLLTYTILRYNLLDISVIIRKGLLYTTLTTIVTGIYLFLAFIIQNLTGISQTTSISSAITTALFVAFIFQPLQNITQTLIDKVFFRRKYEPNLLISQLSEAITSTIEREELASGIVNLVCNTIQIKHAFILLKKPKGNTLSPIYQKGSILPDNFHLAEADEVMAWFQKNQQVVGYYDKINPELDKFMHKYEIELVVPLISKDQIIGLIGFGSKLSDVPYTIEEYTLFGTLGNQAAIAFENSNLLEDVRQEKRKVEKALEREKEVDKQKSEFISIASHNLRTPLTIALGYIDTMLFNRTKYSKDDQVGLDAVFSSLNRLSTITEELLIISQTDDKNIPFTFQTENYLEIVEKVTQKYLPQAKAKGLTIKYHKPNISPTEIVLDKAKVDLALSNLVDNAIKFTEKGEITVRVRKKEKMIIFEVEDTGRGIPKENISNLFSKFYQGNKTQYDYTPGIGTGLYVTKIIAEAHKGEVGVKSEVEKGSIFFISLPIDNKKSY